MKVTINDQSFMKDMKNILDYSVGFLDGVKAGKSQMLKNIGESTIEVLKNYIDTNAKVDPQMLHHVYEWNMTGSPAARLFDINYKVTGIGLSISSTFSQSRSVANGSTTPFYDKARIMEDGIAVTIAPKKASVLRFNIAGEEVFTKNSVTVENPGGPSVQGSYEKTFQTFFSTYFSQAFLQSSGILEYLKTPTLYKKNLSAGKRGGRSVGVSTGYKWIARAGLANVD